MEEDTTPTRQRKKSTSQNGLTKIYTTKPRKVQLLGFCSYNVTSSKPIQSWTLYIVQSEFHDSFSARAF
jgi:hypothetical protein